MADVAEEKQENVKVANIVETDMEESKIQQYYAGTNIFITGATGFLGKLIMEKLLRTCSDVKKVYILIREKKGKTIEQRYEELLENVFFDPIKCEQPNFFKKIEMVTGDCSLPDLGLREEDKQKLIAEVHFIFHCAATVRFDEKIRRASHINIRATKDLLIMAREMKQLKSFVYVSTAFAHCVRKDINEEFYEPAVNGNKLLDLVESLNEDVLAKITPTIIGKWPNTYAFTKAVAEEIVETEGRGLPVAVVRPAIVVATLKEPLVGWIDNMYGATGISVGAALGLIRTLHCNKDCLAEIVPADLVINCIIAAAWDVGTAKAAKDSKKISDESDTIGGDSCADTIPIYNYVASTQKPITWRVYMRYVEKHLKEVPSPLQVWHYTLILNSNYYLHLICLFFSHTVPSYVVDFLAFCIRKERLMVKGYKKIDKFLSVIAYFSTRQWKFSGENTEALRKKLSEKDQQLFNFNMGIMDWDEYFHGYARGGRVYLLKDPLETLPQGRAKYLKLQVAHYVLVTLLLLGLCKILMVLWNALL